MTYTIRNSSNVIVANISPSTTTGTNFAVELVGQQFSLYGVAIAQNFYRLMEHFSMDTPPVNPVEGMIWYDRVNKIPNYYDGTRFISILSASTSYSARFVMLPAATDLDFTVAATTPVFQGLAGLTYYPTGVFLFPRSVLNVSTPAVFNLFTTTAEDIMENTVLSGPTPTKSAFYPIYGMTEPVVGTNQAKLEVSSAATGGGVALRYDVVLFGLVK